MDANPNPNAAVSLPLINPFSDDLPIVNSADDLSVVNGILAVPNRIVDAPAVEVSDLPVVNAVDLQEICDIADDLSVDNAILAVQNLIADAPAAKVSDLPVVNVVDLQDFAAIADDLSVVNSSLALQNQIEDAPAFEVADLPFVNVVDLVINAIPPVQNLIADPLAVEVADVLDVNAADHLGHNVIAAGPVINAIPPVQNQIVENQIADAPAVEVAPVQVLVPAVPLPNHGGLGMNRFAPPYQCVSVLKGGKRCDRSFKKLNGFKKHLNQCHLRLPFECNCLNRFESVGDLEDHRVSDNCH